MLGFCRKPLGLRRGRRQSRVTPGDLQIATRRGRPSPANPRGGPGRAGFAFEPRVWPSEPFRRAKPPRGLLLVGGRPDCQR
eukprot:15446084-Alexandrium_andersonii.AAC.1